MRLWLLISVACASVGCGDGSAIAPGSDLASGDLATAAVDLSSADLVMLADATTAYPAAPYGNMNGATFPPLVWEGYVDPNSDAVATTKPFAPYTMNDVRLSGRAYAMIHVSDFY